MQPRPIMDIGPPRVRPAGYGRAANARPSADVRFRTHVSAAHRVLDPAPPPKPTQLPVPKPVAQPYQPKPPVRPPIQRHTFAPPRPQLIQDIKKPRRHLRRPPLVVIFSTAVFVLGLGLNVNAWRLSQSGATGVAGASTSAKDASNQVLPFDQPPNDEDYMGHKVSADAPRYIRIPALRINARAKTVGFSPDSGIEKPGNIYDMGWYAQSGKPGTDKTMVVSVRSSGLSADSPFAKLSQLKAGNFIEVERGDGQRLSYKVVSTQPIQPGTFSLPSVSRSAEAGKQGLNIVSYDPLSTEDRSTYVPRLIVHAVRIQ